MQNTVLISKAMLFHKIAIIHGKGEFTTNKGSISNVPLETPNRCKILPKPAVSS